MAGKTPPTVAGNKPVNATLRLELLSDVTGGDLEQFELAQALTDPERPLAQGIAKGRYVVKSHKPFQIIVAAKPGEEVNLRKAAELESLALGEAFDVRYSAERGNTVVLDTFKRGKIESSDTLSMVGGRPVQIMLSEAELAAADEVVAQFTEYLRTGDLAGLAQGFADAERLSLMGKAYLLQAMRSASRMDQP